LIHVDDQRALSELPTECYYMSGMHSLLFQSFRAIKVKSPDIRVLWAGEGSDELYGGYPMYLDPVSWARSIVLKIAHSRVQTQLMGKFLEAFHSVEDARAVLIAALTFMEREQLVNNHLCAIRLRFHGKLGRIARTVSGLNQC
jgi:asparagine synthetase B (glutamine-hydrolysing)